MVVFPSSVEVHVAVVGQFLYAVLTERLLLSRREQKNNQDRSNENDAWSMTGHA